MLIFYLKIILVKKVNNKDNFIRFYIQKKIQNLKYDTNININYYKIFNNSKDKINSI